MRLIVMGQQAFGKAALEKLLADGKDEVVAVYCAPDRKGGRIDPLKSLAWESGIPVYQPASLSNPDVQEELRALRADLMIMAYVTLFVPAGARDAPAQGSICFHPSLLPLHRGPSSINWPIIGGATETGFSWFYPTDGLDEGDILLQKTCPIDPDDTLGDVYFRKIFPEAIDSLGEVCDLFRCGDPPRTPQDESRATYESWCKREHVEVDWGRPVDEVYNLIRGANPQPGAWSLHEDTQLQIYDSTKLPGGDAFPGTIVAITEDSVEVQARDGRILMRRVRPASGGKVNAGEWAKEIGLAVGAILGGS